jgi:hypothetical protein
MHFFGRAENGKAHEKAKFARGETITSQSMS